jgi:hypothetical protein
MELMEAQDEPEQMHKALLRFRSDVVSNLTGIEFQRVTVRKGIWLDGHWHEPSIETGNLYARKVLGKILGNRSVWDISPVTRYIAPPDFYEQLVAAAGKRIHWRREFTITDRNDAKDLGQPIISTMPMNVLLSILGIESRQEFRRAPVTVQRFRIPHCDAHQTVYFPTQEHSLYRASLTGDLLICEFAGAPQRGWMDDVLTAMALPIDWEPLDEVKQRYGKIAPIDEGARRHFITTLTNEHNIFSIGRFATWRNLLLDDVVQDAAVVKRLITASHYERKLAAL